jgi:hypothetical protein
MDIFWMIRSGIFFVAGLIVILFPKKVNKFQNYVLEKLHVKYKIKSEKKDYYRIGITFIIISIILFVFSIIN